MTTWKPDADDSFFLHLKIKYSYCPFPAFTKFKFPTCFLSSETTTELSWTKQYPIPSMGRLDFYGSHVNKYTNRPMDAMGGPPPRTTPLLWVAKQVVAMSLWDRWPWCFFRKILKFLDWVVVSKIFYFHPEPWRDDPIKWVETTN